MKKAKKLKQDLSSEKIRYKMYKSGKKWVVAGMTLITFSGAFLPVSTVAFAEEQPAIAQSEEQPTTDNNHISKTDPTKVNVASTKLDLNRKSLNEAITEAKKDSNVTINEKKVNAGVMTKENASKEKARIEAEYQAKAGEIKTKSAQLKAENDKITAENAKKKTAYENDKKRYEKEVKEAEANKNKDGYTKEIIQKYLKFEPSQTAGASVTSISGGQFKSAKSYDNKTEPGSQVYSNLAVLYSSPNAGSLSEANSNKFGGYLVNVKKGGSTSITYDNLNATFDNSKVKKAVFTYTVEQSTNNADVGMLLLKNPSDTIHFGTKAPAYGESEVSINLKVKLFDEKGKEIKASNDKPFSYSVSSLNSRGENSMYEFTKFGNSTRYIPINGTKISNNSGRLYSKMDIDLGTQGIKTSDWDSSTSSKRYYGAGIGQSKSEINLSFGVVKKAVSNDFNGMWFAFNTLAVSGSQVTPVMPEPKYEDLKKISFDVNDYSLYEEYLAQPTKQVLDRNGKDINEKTLTRGDKVNYKMTWDMVGYGEQFKSDNVPAGVFFKDDYDENFLTPTKEDMKITDAKGKDISDQVKVDWNDKDGVVTLTANDPEKFVSTFNGQKLNVDLHFKIKSNIDGELKNTALQNNFDQEVVTNTVVNEVPKINPTKDVVIDVGSDSSLDGKEIALNTVFNYKLKSSIRPENFGGNTDKWTMTDSIAPQDTYTGNSLILATHDFQLSDGTVVKAGTDITKYFTVHLDKGNEATDETKDIRNTLTYTANKEFLDILNSDKNKETEQGFEIYVQVKRSGAGDKIENTAVENMNDEDVSTNTVVTKTPKPKDPTTIEKFIQQGDKRETEVNSKFSDTISFVLPIKISSENDKLESLIFYDDLDENAFDVVKDTLKIASADEQDVTDQFDIGLDKKTQKVTMTAKDPSKWVGKQLVVTLDAVLKDGKTVKDVEKQQFTNIGNIVVDKKDTPSNEVKINVTTEKPKTPEKPVEPQKPKKDLPMTNEQKTNNVLIGLGVTFVTLLGGAMYYFKQKRVK